jgi:hypothetical protein
MRLAAVLFLYRWTDVVEVTAHYSACCDWAACVCALLSSASWQVSFPFLLEQATADWSLSMLGICFVFCQVLILIGCYMWAWQTKCLYDLIRLRLINMWLKNNCLRIILTSSCQGWSTLNTYVGFLRILARLEGIKMVAFWYGSSRVALVSSCLYSLLPHDTELIHISLYHLSCP